MRLGWVQSRTDGCPILIARYAIRAGSELYGRVPILIALYAIRVGSELHERMPHPNRTLCD